MSIIIIIGYYFAASSSKLGWQVIYCNYYKDPSFLYKMSAFIYNQINNFWLVVSLLLYFYNLPKSFAAINY